MVNFDGKNLDRFLQLESLMKKIDGRLNSLEDKFKEKLEDKIKVPKELSVSVRCIFSQLISLTGAFALYGTSFLI